MPRRTRCSGRRGVGNSLGKGLSCVTFAASRLSSRDMHHTLPLHRAPPSSMTRPYRRTPPAGIQSQFCGARRHLPPCTCPSCPCPLKSAERKLLRQRRGSGEGWNFRPDRTPSRLVVRHGASAYHRHATYKMEARTDTTYLSTAASLRQRGLCRQPLLPKFGRLPVFRNLLLA